MAPDNHPPLLGEGLADRTVIITGAAGGVGAACARMFSQVGARVVAIDIDAAGLATTLASLGDPGRHRTISFDLRQVAAINGLITDIVDETGDLWALVHPAAVLRRQSLDEVTPDDWDLQMDVNLKASFFLNRAAGDAMVRNGTGGRIVNFTSGAWLTGPAQGSHVYVASKGGVVSMTWGFARTYGPKGVLVNVISPGQIDTPMQWTDNSPETIEQAMKSCPLGRMGHPDEFASVAVFLASTHASFINGASINVSGGLITH
jgi:NAD(P)-dependent dehydrogenase (short-subunit alcohol dehydrogenase family)